MASRGPRFKASRGKAKVGQDIFKRQKGKGFIDPRGYGNIQWTPLKVAIATLVLGVPYLIFLVVLVMKMGPMGAFPPLSLAGGVIAFILIARWIQKVNP